MNLDRFKQGYKGIHRKFGVHGRMILDHKSIGGKVVIYTLESMWDKNNDEPNGIVGRSCVSQGSYTVHVEKSPLNNREYPFLVNESLGVCLRTKLKSTDRTGYCFYDEDINNPIDIYGRFILCGTSYQWKNAGFYMPTNKEEAVSIINKYVKETGDNNVRVRWIN